MRRITSLLSAAIIAVSLYACAEKHVESEPIGDITEPVEIETVTDPVYLELTEEDFTPVDINCDITDTEPPFKVNSADLSSLDFGERMSPCKEQEDARNAALYPHYMEESENKELYEEAVQTILDNPSGGMVTDLEFIDGKYYLSVNYDNLCGCHDSSIYSYEVETGNFKEVIRHTGLEYNGAFDCLTSSHGKLFYVVKTYVNEKNENDSVGSQDFAYSGNIKYKARLFSINPESGNESELCLVDGDVQLINESEKGLAIYSYRGGYSRCYLTEYDIESGELSEYENENGNNRVLCDGVPAEISGGFDREKHNPITIKTQYYTITTDINYYTDIYLWKDKASIVYPDDKGGTWMYTYDLTNHEQLKMRYDRFKDSRSLQTEDGVLIIDPVSEKLYYVYPVLGTVYTLDTYDPYIDLIYGESGKNVFYMTFTGENENNINGMYVGYTNGKGLPDKLNWFETQ
ncbi:MAG: hypothetical protein J6Y71_01990 [Ruminococcus sp.]|nr:hypothetical protein [Ruminococcus sp.]